MFEDISAEFGSFRLKPRKTRRGRKNNGGNAKKSGTVSRYNGNYGGFDEQPRYRQPRNNGRRNQRRGGRRKKPRKLSAEELQMVEETNLRADAPRFSSAYEWKEPMFLSPFVAKAPVKEFNFNPNAAEFVPQNE